MSSSSAVVRGSLPSLSLPVTVIPGASFEGGRSDVEICT
jgi:hypothetical protein